MDKVTKSPAFVDSDFSYRNPIRIPITTNKVKQLLVRMLYRVNLKGFFNHCIILNKMWIKREMLIPISTTNVETLFSEFNRATNRLQMQSGITEEYGQTLCAIFHFRRILIERVSKDKNQTRKMNSQRNNYMEAMMDYWDLMESNEEKISLKWLQMCDAEKKK